MNINQAVVLNLAFALILANLPFVRIISVRRWHAAWSDFIGWIAGYALWMCAAAALEATAGASAGKSWEIWAVTTALFAVLASPGVVWRHLLQK